MTLMDRIVAWNARQSQRWFVPNLMFKAFAGFLLAGVILAILVPALHTRGIALQGWMIWGVMILMIVVCTAPDLYQRYRRELKQ
jgi:hypothetical protein